MGERGRLVRHATDNTVDRRDDDAVMRVALEMTRETFPHPNPRVGAVIVSPDGAIVSAAAHQHPGDLHAERLAIADLDVTGHTLVVTLEPCDHTGLTPPCTEAIIEAGISRVVVGAGDPDPRVQGRGVARLREAGIDVVEGVLADAVEANDAAYFFHRRSGRAMVTLKVAATLDGQVAARDGTSRWITGEEARRDAHGLRAAHDAVLVGAGTVIADDPELTVRLEGHAGPQPRPVLLAGRRELPEGARVLARDPLVYADAGGVDVRKVVEDLPTFGILSVLVEGGPTVAASFLDEGLVDEVVWYVAGRLAGGTGIPAISGVFATVADARPVSIVSLERLGEDLKVVCRPEVR
jgi:diaminohydroxyphosphoribosylaminopyrimidine deaminase/5-amino-6-(5-phosphoribosylamino)uracil reductase